jgi:3-deoxy-D-manno-octulosonic-acid transferase
MIFSKKYRLTIPARFFLKNNNSLKEGGVWFHGCSFGEVKSFEPIITKLDKIDVCITTTTDTGIIEAKKLTKNFAYLPYEIFLPFWIVKHNVLVVTEAELWYLLFFVAKKKGAKTILINARISDNSYHKYLKIAFLYKKIFANIDIIFAQSQKDKKRLESLGAKNIVVNGNIKSSKEIVVTKKYKKPIQTVITLASTHEGEEEKILSFFKNFEGIKVLIVPRHPARFKKVENLTQKFAKDRGLSFGKFSENPQILNDITLVDVMGELINIYAISDIVLLGGSFVDNIGGHNPLEPANFGCFIISGEFYFNQSSLYELVENIKIIKNDELRDDFYLKMNLNRTRIISKGDIEMILKEIKI